MNFFYFGYAKNATNGFFDTTSSGLTSPVVSLNPATLANSWLCFWRLLQSPALFFLNSGRLEFRGSLVHQLLEYKFGGNLGIQTVDSGHDIHDGSGGNSLSKALDGNLIFNMTDWLALYGDVDYLDAGGQYNRWRYGGGIIVRPHINALSPLIGAHSKQPDPSNSQ